MNIRKDKDAFLKRLEVVRPLLPQWYAKSLKTKFPQYNRHKFYSIRSGKSVDFAVLSEMEKMVNEIN